MMYGCRDLDEIDFNDKPPLSRAWTGVFFFKCYMNRINGDKVLKNLKWVIILLVLFLASCVYDNEFTYMNDQILILNKRVAELEKSLEPKIDERIGSTLDSHLTDIKVNRAEIDIIKRDTGQLKGRVEDNENLIRRSVEKDLGNQDTIKKELVELTKLSSKVEELDRLLRQQQGILGLEPEKSQEEESKDLETVTEDTATDVPGLYDLSLTAFREDNYEKAREGFKQFLKENPKSDYADNAQYWIGESLMGLKQYEQAILAFNEVIKKYPKGNKVPNAMYRQGVAFLEINDKISARLLLEKVIKQYPKEDITKAAKAKLKSIR